MADPKHTTEEEPDEKTKRNREEARQRRLERSTSLSRALAHPKTKRK
jgi:hypothetical protein